MEEKMRKVLHRLITCSAFQPPTQILTAILTPDGVFPKSFGVTSGVTSSHIHLEKTPLEVFGKEGGQTYRLIGQNPLSNSSGPIRLFTASLAE